MTTATPAITAITIDPVQLSRALRVGHLFAGTDETLPILGCLHITADVGKLTITATDRYGLAMATLDSGDGQVDMLLHRRHAKRLAAEVAAMARWRRPDQEVELVIVDHGDGIHLVGARCGHMEAVYEPHGLDASAGSYPDVAGVLAEHRARETSPGRAGMAVFQPWAFWKLARAARIVYPQTKRRSPGQDLGEVALAYLTVGGPKTAAVAQMDWLTAAVMPSDPRPGVAGYIAPAEPAQ